MTSEPAAPASLTDQGLAALAERLLAVPGVVAVALGGSRARGDALPSSDVDLGLYVDARLDLAALGALARDVSGPDATVSPRGAWGPWVDGGAWLTVGGVPVDWIYRDVARVARAVDDAVAGVLTWHVQPGHPLGFPGVAYAAEVAACRVLGDPTGLLAGLRGRLDPYPPALADAFAAGVWEAGFLLDAAAKGARRDDATYVAGCLVRALGVCAHALLARAGRWPTNEKGLVALAGRAPGAPRGWSDDAQALVGALGSGTVGLAASVRRARDLVDAVVGAVVGEVPRADER